MRIHPVPVPLRILIHVPSTKICTRRMTRTRAWKRPRRRSSHQKRNVSRWNPPAQRIPQSRILGPPSGQFGLLDVGLD
ncbi:uncharacterized protein AFUA_5G01720 [Aspergillus fumigatus Af293]|uniref:Uncharacterized protein n=2 Tax=Aspergillus fumigatus TaxID=746128 RepID=Q4WE45_ASPFU|nr:hypothetical protein AFUA_5G01720 [Aspergillus fumigatus Af293]EAL86132.1 hypothetical protein AFUA_5G01720 [Aspergillus fumigatus Af293]EDP51023.1 hypothetical protein AFUB_050250 [Aspergillus fumigatus A1163]